MMNQSSLEFKRIYIEAFLTIGLFAVIVISLSWVQLDKIKQGYQSDLVQTLEEGLGKSQEIEKIWFEAKYSLINHFARMDDIQHHIKKLLIDFYQKKKPSSEQIHHLRAHFFSLLVTHSGLDFKVLTPEGYILASTQDSLIGQSFEEVVGRELFANQKLNDRILVLPYRSDVDYPASIGGFRDKNLIMSLLIPIWGDNNNVIAMFGIDLDPTGEFTKIAQLAQTGKTGDIYFFNQEGYLLTESRFEEELKAMEILGGDESSILTINLNNTTSEQRPDVKANVASIESPNILTSVKGFHKKKSINIEGYNNYRGVNVVGIWDWHDDLNFGMTYEITFDEAYQTYTNIKNYIIIFIVIIILLFSIMIFMAFQKRVSEAKSKQKMKTNQTLLKEAERVGKVGFWSWDLSTGSMFWSDEIYRMYGFIPLEIQPSLDTILSKAHPDDKNRLQTELSQAIKGQSDFNITHRVILNDSTIFFLTVC